MLSGSRMRRPSVSVAIAVTLPLLLVVVVAGIGIAVRLRGSDAPSAETGPLAIANVEAPAAGSPSCAALLAGLDGDLPAGPATLPSRPLAPPAPAGVRAWAATPAPIVLRCGLPRPAELTPTSELLEVDGVRWLTISDGAIVTSIAVDRPVYVALTAPAGIGSGPLQAVSDVVRTTLPAQPVAVR
jgi:Protein of unknown function (DUF3515)